MFFTKPSDPRPRAHPGGRLGRDYSGCVTSFPKKEQKSRILQRYSAHVTCMDGGYETPERNCVQPCASNVTSCDNQNHPHHQRDTGTDKRDTVAPDWITTLIDDCLRSDWARGQQIMTAHSHMSLHLKKTRRWLREPLLMCPGVRPNVARDAGTLSQV